METLGSILKQEPLDMYLQSDSHSQLTLPFFEEAEPMELSRIGHIQDFIKSEYPVQNSSSVRTTDYVQNNSLSRTSHGMDKSEEYLHVVNPPRAQKIKVTLKLKPARQSKPKSKKTSSSRAHIPCPECSSKFRTKRDLQSHLKTHATAAAEKAKPSKTTKSKPRNSKSVVTIEAAPSFPCRLCSCSFKSKLAFDIHECLGSDEESPDEYDEGPSMDSTSAADLNEDHESPLNSPAPSPDHDNDRGDERSPTFDLTVASLPLPIPKTKSPSTSKTKPRESQGNGNKKSRGSKRGRRSGSPKTSRKVKVRRPRTEKSREQKLIRDDIFTDANGKRQLKCCGCDQTFKRSDRRELHIAKSHPEIQPEHKCGDCEERFYYNSALTFHLPSHLKEKNHSCQYCEEKFHSADKLYRHEKTHDASQVEMKYLCQFCSKPFATKEQVEKHERQVDHNKSQEIKCPHCPRIYNSKRSFNNHMTTCHSSEPKREIPPCKICGKEFASRQSLIAHERNHERKKEKRFQCQVCGKAFAHKCLLNDHMTKHTGERPLKCKHCDMTFRKSSDRYEHFLRKHVPDEDKPHKCSICSKGFIRAEIRLAHERTHTGERPFSCSNCEAAFHSKLALNHHHRKHHEGRANVKDVPCPTCNKMFLSQAAVRYHEKHVHGMVRRALRFDCRYCAKGFVSKYAREVHERSHTGEKPFQCEACNSHFRSKESLVVHQRNAHKN